MTTNSRLFSLEFPSFNDSNQINIFPGYPSMSTPDLTCSSTTSSVSTSIQTPMNNSPSDSPLEQRSIPIENTHKRTRKNLSVKSKDLGIEEGTRSNKRKRAKTEEEKMFIWKQRTIRNRAAAERSRQKKREFYESLEKSNAQLKEQNMALMKRLEALETDNIKMREQLSSLLSNSTSNSTSNSYPSQNNLQIQQEQQDQHHEQPLSEEMLDVSDVLWQSPSELSLFPDTALFSCHDELSSQYLSIPENPDQSCSSSSSSRNDYLTIPEEDIPLDRCFPSPILSLSSSPSSTSTSTESSSSPLELLSSISVPSSLSSTTSLSESCTNSLPSISSLPMYSPETMSLAFRILLDSFGTSAARTAIMMNYYYNSTSSQQRNTVLPMYYHPTLTFQTILPIQSSQTSAPISLLVIVHQYLMNFVRILSILGGVTRMDWLPLESSKSIDINKKDMERKRNFLVESESMANVNIEPLMNNHNPDLDVDGHHGNYDENCSMLLLLESERIRLNHQFKWEENWRNEVWRRLVFGENINSVNMLRDSQKNEISEILLS